MVCRKILVLDGKMTFIMLDKFQINKLNYGYSAELKTSLWVTISCCLVLLCLFSLDNSMPSNVSESAFAGSGDTSLNTVANNSSAMIEEGSIILTNNDTGIVKQETSMSEPAPVRHPGQPPHEVLFHSAMTERSGQVEQLLLQVSLLKLRYFIFTIHGKI